MSRPKPRRGGSAWNGVWGRWRSRRSPCAAPPGCGTSPSGTTRAPVPECGRSVEATGEKVRGLGGRSLAETDDGGKQFVGRARAGSRGGNFRGWIAARDLAGTRCSGCVWSLARKQYGIQDLRALPGRLAKSAMFMAPMVTLFGMELENKYFTVKLLMAIRLRISIFDVQAT